MRSKILVRILIVLLAAFLIFRIHQRVEAYRVPREFCRSQISVLAEANVQYIFEQEGMPAPDVDSLLTYAKNNGYFETSMSEDSIRIVFRNGRTRDVLIPEEWKELWGRSAVEEIENRLVSMETEHDALASVMQQHESELGFPLDSLVSLREMYIAENPLEADADTEDEDYMSPGDIFDDSLGFSPQELIDEEAGLASSVDSLESMLQNFNDVIAPARRDSVSSLVAAVCPTLWQAGHYDSVYSYDPKLALGTQFSISCPNHERHGGIVGGFIEKDYPDTLFVEPDWSETQTVYAFPEFAVMRRYEVSRANLFRAAEEEAAYLAQRYPAVIIPKRPENLEVSIDELIDPLGGEYVFELLPDTSYVFYENPEGRTARSRGDSVVVETKKFVGYTTADPDTSRVEVFFSRPLDFPSRTEGATPGTNDQITVIRYWDRSELGSLQIDEREVDLLAEPTWDVVKQYFGHSDTTETE